MTLVEFVSGHRTYVGAPAADFTVAKAMVTIAGKHDRLPPRFVCGAPTATRTLPLDLATGTVTEK